MYPSTIALLLIIIITSIISAIALKIKSNKARKSKDFLAMVECYAQKVIPEGNQLMDIVSENDALSFVHELDKFAAVKVDGTETIIFKNAFMLPASKKDFISELNKMEFEDGIRINVLPDPNSTSIAIQIASPIQLSYGKRWFNEIDECVNNLRRVGDDIRSSFKEYNSRNS